MKFLSALIISLLTVGPSCAVFAQDGCFLPPAGKTLMFIGQSTESIYEYSKVFNRKPDGVMIYTSLNSLEGIDSPVDRGAGTQYADELTEKYPDSALQIGLNLVGQLDDVNSGGLDQNIDRLAVWIKGLKKPVYLRIGYEFDFPDNNYSPESYKSAFIRIVERIRTQNPGNAAFVWHSCASLQSTGIESYYPGDEYVDWAGISYFDNGTCVTVSKFTAFAKEHGKPLMICEAAPMSSGVDMGIRSYYKWYRPFFQFIARNDIRIACYINMNWDDLPMFYSFNWGNSRVQDNPVIKAKWIEETTKPRFRFSVKSLGW